MMDWLDRHWFTLFIGVLMVAATVVVVVAHKDDKRMAQACYNKGGTFIPNRGGGGWCVQEKQ